MALKSLDEVQCLVVKKKHPRARLLSVVYAVGIQYHFPDCSDHSLLCYHPAHPV
jgi:hypothetical protein